MLDTRADANDEIIEPELPTVYVECSAMYRQSGSVALRPVGEAEFVAGMAAMSDSGLYARQGLHQSAK
jgi:hypothetical protein